MAEVIDPKFLPGGAERPSAVSVPALAPEPPPLQPALPPIPTPIQVPPAPSPLPAPVTVTVREDDREPLKEFFGFHPSDEQFASFVGSPKDATIEVIWRPEDNGVQWKIDSPNVQAKRFLECNAQGQLIMYNEILEIKDQGVGTGTALFAQQVEALLRLGVSQIRCFAAKGKTFNGYYTWPRLGYDGELSEEIRAQLPEQFRPAASILDLCQMPGGLEWWKEHGDTEMMWFDLSPGSRSLQILRSYLEERRRRKSVRTGRKRVRSKPRGGHEELRLSQAEEQALDALWKRLARS